MRIENKVNIHVQKIIVLILLSFIIIYLCFVIFYNCYFSSCWTQFGVIFLYNFLPKQKIIGIIIFWLVSSRVTCRCVKAASPKKVTDWSAMINHEHIILSWVECSYRSYVIADFSAVAVTRDERITLFVEYLN